MEQKLAVAWLQATDWLHSAQRVGVVEAVVAGGPEKWCASSEALLVRKSQMRQRKALTGLVRGQRRDIHMSTGEEAVLDINTVPTSADEAVQVGTVDEEGTVGDASLVDFCANAQFRALRTDNSCCEEGAVGLDMREGGESSDTFTGHGLEADCSHSQPQRKYCPCQIGDSARRKR